MTRARKRPGQPPFKPTAEQRNMVEGTAGFGMPEEDISELVINPKSGEPISPTTLRKHFRRELDRGHAAATAKVALSLYKNATEKDNVIAQMFWLKCRARWQQNPERNPPPPPQPPETDLQDAARRIAFMLAAGSAANESATGESRAKPPAVKKKRKRS